MISVSALSKTFGRAPSEVRAVQNIAFEVATGSLTTLLGPSGCGKTTSLRMVAGLEVPSAGEIMIDGEIAYSDTTGSYIPVHRRAIGMVFQSYAIWPHMSVLKNVAFPLFSIRPRLSRQVVRERTHEALELVGLGDLGDRPATNLSGGQQQRVALARAIVARPKVLLLDEPLSNLDASLRERVREEIRSLQQALKITTIMVTHDQVDALAISDAIILMSDGRIVEQGPPDELYRRPRHDFTASFLGTNLLPGVVESSSDGSALVRTRLGAARCLTTVQPTVDQKVTVSVRPENIELRPSSAEATGESATVLSAVYRGNSWRYRIQLGDVTAIVHYHGTEFRFQPGDQVDARITPDTAVVVAELQRPLPVKHEQSRGRSDAGLRARWRGRRKSASTDGGVVSSAEEPENRPQLDRPKEPSAAVSVVSGDRLSEAASTSRDPQG